MKKKCNKFNVYCILNFGHTTRVCWFSIFTMIQQLYFIPWCSLLQNTLMLKFSDFFISYLVIGMNFLHFFLTKLTISSNFHKKVCHRRHWFHLWKIIIKNFIHIYSRTSIRWPCLSQQTFVSHCVRLVLDWARLQKLWLHVTLS